MYQAERLDLIARAVREAGRVSVRELAEQFDITTETVRRDLQGLEEAGALQRVHGGAIAVRRASLVERGVGERLADQGDEKKRIAERAAHAIPSHFSGSILIDAGTTTAALLDPLLARIAGGSVQIVTNAVAHAAALAGRDGVSLTVLGGRVRTVTGAAVGIETVRDIERLRPDVAFIGTNGFSTDFGLSTPDVDEAAVKNAMVRAARRVIVLSDSSKFGDESLTRFAGLDDIDVVVTDAEPPADLAAAFELADAEVWVA
ncbi:D-beta-D-heptose 1-phosphate adenosyltransferase [Microbacterium sorbitolivorans]|uniref:Lactose phosphotransferase system repressor n=1 Tax=Microbacterium sorbitolivorans TaxID=1867410 RepID=A0A367XY48_9MICO|nr:DeoR/GlpR family DNA-binding transcription regulator [Microbacterium sorbitolivorans]RCK58547.1 DeoR/GlpR transcriptional regulator [Microbacterium sorbitolivorans]GGF37422.1 D-beta-D-heptose 1-phosphate adenosyltransferase [Microbacterium sorbitolivorans]